MEITPLGADNPESYRDGVLPWIASVAAVMFIGAGVVAFLLLILALI